MGIDLVPHAILRMQNLKVWSFVDPEKMLVEKSKNGVISHHPATRIQG